MNHKNTIALLIIALISIGIYYFSTTQEQETGEIQEDVEEPSVEVIEVVEKGPIEEPKEQYYKIDIVHNNFEPKELMVKTGSIVTWTNKDTKAHKVYHKSADKKFRSNVINPGYSFSYKFEEKGEYLYADAIFNYMQGKIIVEDSIILVTGNAIKLQLSNSYNIISSLFLSLIILITISAIIFKRKHIVKNIHK